MQLPSPPLERKWATEALPTHQSLRTIDPIEPAITALRRDRLLFIDNIRTMLTILVVLHHLAVTYTWSVGWY